MVATDSTHSWEPLTSRKTKYVWHFFPDFCHVWFLCNGRLIDERCALKYPSLNVEKNKLKRIHYLESSIKFRATQSVSSSSSRTPTAHCDSSTASVQAGANKKELARVKEELKDTKTQLDALSQELLKASNLNSSLESLVDKCSMNLKEMEKLVYAEKKWLKCNMECHKLQIEHDNAFQGVQESRRPSEQGSSSSHVLVISSEFSLSDIEEATNCFHPSLKIGEEGCGCIYKGFLRHTEVAIKVLQHNSSQSLMEFQQEVDFLSKLHHPNLVTLIGACQESLALIYEYLPNGSLEDRLSCKDNTPPLPWQTRIRIATELCSVLNFLHSSRPTVIIHGDLKPENVLLDANFVCKLSGFGICHTISKDRQYDATNPKGTSSHLDPEFLETGKLTPKSDVYSFGIILLRLLTGEPGLGRVKEVRHALEKDDLHSTLDPSAGDWPFVRAKQLTYLALRCCDMNASSRPDLATEVWSVLKPIKVPLGNLSTLRLVSEDNVPSYFICPIFQEIMHDPHFAADGFTYEGNAIRGWFENGHDTSPMTNLKLANFNLTPNRALRSAIQEWLNQYQIA